MMGELNKAVYLKLRAWHVEGPKTLQIVSTPQHHLLKPPLLSQALLNTLHSFLGLFKLSLKHSPTTLASYGSPAHPLFPVHAPVKPIWKWKNSWWNEEERRNEKAKLSAPSLAKGAKAGNIHLIDRFSGTLPYRIHTAQHVHRDWFQEYHLFWNTRYKLGKSHVFSPIGTWHSTKNYMTHQKV